MFLSYEPDGQGHGSMFRICQALLKNAILLHSSLVAGVYFFHECSMFIQGVTAITMAETGV